MTEKYVILISFPRQQWFRERASELHYTYAAYLVKTGHDPCHSNHVTVGATVYAFRQLR